MTGCLFLGKSFGYNVGFRYNRGYTRFPDRILRILEYSSDPAAEELNTNLDLSGNQSFENTNFGGILSMAYQFNNSNEIQLNTMYNHDTEKQAASLSGIFPWCYFRTSHVHIQKHQFSRTVHELMHSYLEGT